MEAICCRSTQQINEDEMFNLLEQVEKDLKAWCGSSGYVWRGKNRALLTDLKDSLTDSIENGVVVEYHIIARRYLSAVLAHR